MIQVLDISYGRDLFYNTPFGYLLPVVPLLRGTVLDLEEIESVNTPLLPFRMFQSVSGDNPSAFVFQPTVQCTNFGTGLMMFYPSWLRNAKPLSSEEVLVALKFPGLYAYSALNKMTLVTTSELSDSLHDYLTML
jgi:hypothetical protein